MHAMVKMSDYHIGAFEALEWTWHILRKYDETPQGIKNVRNVISETLFRLGKGDNIKFKDKVLESISNKEPTPTIEVYDS